MTDIPEITGYGLAPGEGEVLDWMGEPTILKATGDHTSGRYALAEIVSTPEGFVPLHIHHREDEAFLILEGEVRFTVAESVIEGGPGTFAFGPRDIPHRYEVLTPLARMLLIFSPAGFEGFIRETSVEPGTAPQEPDLEAIAEAAARYGSEMLDG
jgi:quercetin dioxygenase-like cupin family protein